MDLYEYQARQVFKEYGVPVLDYRLASTPDEAREGARELLAAGASLLVVKAQVKTGGRGKAGGVKLAHTADEAAELARAILGLDIKGHVVRRVMIASGANIAAEYYFSILLDRSNRRHLAMCSRVRVAWTSRPSPRSAPRRSHACPWTPGAASTPTWPAAS